MQKLLTVIAVSLVLILSITLGRTIIGLLTPVIFACFLVLLLMPLVDKLEEKLKSRLLASSLVTGTTVLVLTWLIWLLVARLYREAEKFTRSIPSIYNSAQQIFEERLWPLVQGTPFEESMETVIDEVLGRGIATLNTAATMLLDYLGALPGILVGVMVTLVMTFFILYDKEWLMKVIPGARENLGKILHSVHGFIKVQFFLISVTAIISMITLAILNVPYVFVYGITIAVLDLLPILGAGTLLIPMGIWYIFIGMPFKGITILVIYIVVISVRQIIEPKLLSVNLGIHPVIAILCLYFGLQFFGVLGLIVLPLLASVMASFPKYSWMKR